MRINMEARPSRERIGAGVEGPAPVRERITIMASQENLTHETVRSARAGAFAHRLLLGLTTLFLAGVVYGGILAPLLGLLTPWQDILGFTPLGTVVFVLFSLGHACYTLGWRPTLVFFTLSALVTWAFEQAGVSSGAVYGAYHYTDQLGAKLGHVPVLIPLSWFMMIYPSYVMANLIVNGRPTTSGTESLLRIVWMSFVGSMVITAWDLLIELTSSGPGGAWIWEEGGPYFGVPLQNFVGWVLTTFTVYLLYLLIERRIGGLKPMGRVTLLIAAMPVVAYASRLVLHTAVGGEGSHLHTVVDGPAALWVIGPFAMGLPLVAAVSRLWDYGAKYRPR
jgi:uncharacterized membrane protein